MKALLCRVLGAAIGLWAADAVLIGVELASWQAWAVGSVVLAGVHGLVRPVLLFFTFPITLLTLGTSLWVINAALLWGTGWLVSGVDVRGIVPALLGAGLISACAGVAHQFGEPPDDAVRG